DQFLTALEAKPTNHATAEGLAMAVYRSGDLAAAWKLGQQLGDFMPGIPIIIAGAVESDVRSLVAAEHFEEAEDLLSHFPYADRHYRPAHEFFAHAQKIHRAVGEETLSDLSES
ncbi:MAG: hypothetical protein AAF236_01935, partial [Verrucomicrobiota bacterium]